MSIGSKIKNLRKAKNLTQEDLAEYLNISSKAVSQWECDRTTPDISQLPALCNFFDITSDELLEIDIMQKEKRINSIREKAESYDSRGYKIEAYRVLEQGLHEFPNSYGIMTDLMHESFYLMYDDSYSKEERKKYRAQAIFLGEQILERSLDDSQRYSAIQSLCMIYSQGNERDRAFELAKKLPTLVVSREFMYSHIFNGSEGYMCDKKLISALIDALVNINFGRKDDSGAPFYNEDEKAIIRDKIIAFISLMYENNDYGFLNCHLAKLHTSQANYYAQQTIREKTLYHLSQAALYATGFVEYANKETFVHTSLLLRGYETCGKSFITSESDNDAQILLNHINSSKYDFIRNTTEYGEITGMLKEYAAKWNSKN